MTPNHRTWALSALALTLILGACSTPADLTAPTLKPQFGTTQNDFGVDAATASSGRVYVLSAQKDDDNSDYDYYDAVVLRRYDANGALNWTREVASASCDYNCGAYGVEARTLAADSRGYSYALITYSGVEQDCATAYYHYVEKYDASGNFIRSVYVGINGSPFGYTTGAEFTDVADLAVDSSGNLYVAYQAIDFSDDYCDGKLTNVVAKYSATGALQWQRLSTVGIPYGISLSSSGFVYVAGSTGVAKYSGSGDLRWTKAGIADDITVVGTNTIYARYRSAVRKLDANGKQLWSKTQTGLSGMVVADMTTDAKANLYLTGKYSTSSRGRDVFTRKLSSSGGTLFTKTFGTTAYDDANGIATLNGSEIYLTGATQSALVPPYRGGENDGYVRKLNSSGNLVWTR